MNVVYGIGIYYESIKEELFQQIHIDYLCDRRFEGEDAPEIYDGIQTIGFEKIKEVRDAFVIVAVKDGSLIKKELDAIGVKNIHVNQFLKIQSYLTGKYLKENYPHGIYEDSRNNRIEFDNTLSDNIAIEVIGKNNQLHIGKNVTINRLCVAMGSNGSCCIGEGTKVMDAEFSVSGASLNVGMHCLFSIEIVVRTEDGHQIFDKDSHERLNYAKSVIIEDNVWIGRRAMLFKGAHIGKGSIVAAGCITSKSFGNHELIAGIPGRAIRDNVCWSYDDTLLSNHDCLEECYSREALMYM